jgi:hypothetical protein
MAQEAEAKEQDRARKRYRITIDGEEHIVTEDELTVRQLLELAEVDPQNHVLVQIIGRKQIRHEDLDEVIKMKSGLRFVTVSKEPTPVA